MKASLHCLRLSCLLVSLTLVKMISFTLTLSIIKVKLEMALKFLGLNIAKLFRFYETGKTNEFWTAPEDLEAEEFKKPSAKRLSKKGDRINKRQEEARKKEEERKKAQNGNG